MSQDGSNTADDADDGNVLERSEIVERKAVTPKELRNIVRRERALEHIDHHHSHSNLPSQHTPYVRPACIAAATLPDVESTLELRCNDARRNGSHKITEEGDDNQIVHETPFDKLCDTIMY